MLPLLAHSSQAAFLLIVPVIGLAFLQSSKNKFKIPFSFSPYPVKVQINPFS
jgi:hypothetical protein